MKKVNGFTLIELIMVIVILGILSAVALPKFASLGTNARISSLKSLAGGLQSTADIIRLKCITSSLCDESLRAVKIRIDGVYYWLNYGYPDAGNTLDNGQIDSFIDTSGFKKELIVSNATKFFIEKAPDPQNCSVTYFDAYYLRGDINISQEVSGC